MTSKMCSRIKWIEYVRHINAKALWAPIAMRCHIPTLYKYTYSYIDKHISTDHMKR